ncbi:hypothetical protein SAMD00019534_111970 [Acytostelium subglobosum LB1]|uniref:hypothetical protein n=1 Tax=Acytostelium subglobosum LB1 TaxID=1410327 RepID=UPI00064514EF|nr:hypothetical protein SAMD00019534_111970 [Acytostelium subglobosum LB1]GAM28021.1 hypothetical protein SAMD00019534_111970 [Acytostelium subglobosum LB1]|eukprot:XP_012748980.1 hypothetical protein SAMD00019534_111970 [Acytostelium subglobosum LB1]
MGVPKLWDLVQSTGTYVELDELQGQTLAIDASIWLHSFVNAFRDGRGDPDPNAHILGFFWRICKLLQHRIKPVLVFDGEAPYLKMRTIEERRKRRENNEALIEKNQRKMLLLNTLKAQLAKANGNQDLASKDLDSLVDDLDFDYDFDDNNEVDSDLEIVDDTIIPASNSINQPVDVDQLDDNNNNNNNNNNNTTQTSDNLDDDDDDIGDYIGGIDDGQFIHTFEPEEIDKEVFSQLPQDIQLEVLSQMKQEKKVQDSLSILTPPKTPIDFSKHQIGSILQKGRLTRKISEVKDNMEPEMKYMNPDGETIFILHKSNTAPSLAYGSSSSTSTSSSTPSATSSTLKTKAMTLSDKLALGTPIRSQQKPKRQQDDMYKQQQLNVNSASSSTQSSPLSAKLSSNFELLINRKISSLTPSKTLDNVVGDRDQPVFARSNTARNLINDLVQAKNTSNIDSATSTPNKTPTKTPTTSKSFTNDFSMYDDDAFNFDQPFDDDYFDEGPTTSTTSTATTTTTTTATSQTNTSSQSMSSKNMGKDTFTAASLVSRDKPLAFKIVGGGDSTSGKEANKVNHPIDLSDDDNDGPAVSISSPEIDSSPQQQQPQDVDIVVDNNDNQQSQLSQSQSQQQQHQQQDHQFKKPKSKFDNVDIFDLDGPDVAQDQQKNDDAITINDQEDDKDIIVEIAHDDDQTYDGQAVGDDHIDEHPFTHTGNDNHNGDNATATSAGPSNGFHQGARFNYLELRDLDKEREENEDPKSTQSSSKNKLIFEYFNSNERDRLDKELELEKTATMNVISQKVRSFQSIDDEMLRQCHDLLTLFGIPFITAPTEAEAQCAELFRLGLVDGVVTEDSDIMLFGDAKLVVYRHLFHRPERYILSDIVVKVGLNREDMINLALLLGCDYTVGIKGIGIVNAMEIISEFNDLVEFKTFMKSAAKSDAAAAKQMNERSHLKGLVKNVLLPESFPSDLVKSAFYSPDVNSSDEPFSWANPDWESLRRMAVDKFGWERFKAENLLQPIMRIVNQHDTTATQPSGRANNNPASSLPSKLKSKRLAQAIERIIKKKNKQDGDDGDGEGEVEGDAPQDEDMDNAPVDMDDGGCDSVKTKNKSSKKKKKSKTTPKPIPKATAKPSASKKTKSPKRPKEDSDVEEEEVEEEEDDEHDEDEDEEGYKDWVSTGDEGSDMEEPDSEDEKQLVDTSKVVPRRRKTTITPPKKTARRK